MKTYKIAVEQNKLDDLRNRIKNTRWISGVKNPNQDAGMDTEYLKMLSQYWVTDFNWKKQEDYLNSFNQFTTNIDNLNVHFIYEKGTGDNPVPILFLHGWAECYTKYLKLVEILKRENPGVDIIVPSLPGFGFSEEPVTTLNSDKVAEIIYKLMTEVLGYRSFYIHGGDFGSFVGEKIAQDHPQSVRGLHLTDVPFYHLYGYNEDLSDEEKGFMERVNVWSMQHGAYAMIQSTKPQTLAQSLNDSPIGMASWLLQLFHDMSDTSKDLHSKFNKDELLTNISLYWLIGCIYSSMRIYAEDSHGFGGSAGNATTVPAGFCFYPYDISGIPPKAFVNRFFQNIVHWTEQESGGHFGAMENPSTLHEDIMKFVQKVERKQKVESSSKMKTESL